MVESRLWTWLILLAGFAGLYTIFLNINIWVKIITIYLFSSCFFSSAIYFAFTAYISYIACLYYYILSLRFMDWKLVKKALLIILLLNGILLCMQILNCDTLLNFGLKDNKTSGVVGNFMNLKSLIIILIAFLISYLNITIKNIKAWGVLIGTIIFIAIITYNIDHKVFMYFPIIRGKVWLETIRLTAYNGTTAFLGWGLGCFKITFNQIAKIGVAKYEGSWLTPHNCWLQILYETGFIGFTLVLLYAVDLFHRLIANKLYSMVIGLSLICADMMVHFPDRRISTVFLIIAFLAFCEYKIKESLCQRQQL